CSVTHTGSVAAGGRPRIGWSPQPLRVLCAGPAVLPMPSATRSARLSACFRLRLAPPPGAGCSEGEVGAVLRVEQLRPVRVDPQLQLLALAGAAGGVEAGHQRVARLGGRRWSPSRRPAPPAP